jgi:cytochrome P450
MPMSVAPELKIHRSVTKALKIFDADRLRWLDEAAALGPIVALRMGPVKTFIVTDADAARTMLVADAASWRRPPATLTPIRVGVGENLFTQSDKAWARLQPAVAPAFRKKALEARLAGIGPLIDAEVRALPTGTTVDLELAMGRIALILAAWVLLGERLDATRAEEIAHHQRAVVGWVGRRTGAPTGFLPFAPGADGREMKRHRAVLNAYADEVIARAQAVAPGDDALGALIRARPMGRALSADQLRGHVLGLFLAGNETTTAALSWALVHGAQAPQEWAKVAADPQQHTMPFLNETLRLHPAVWGIPRSPTKAGTTLTTDGNPFRVRRGQVTTIYLRGMHRDPTTWDEPLRFDPTRHECGAKEQQRSLLPFGLGPRGCIGQHLALAEMSAVLPALARLGTLTVDGPIAEDANFALRVRGGLRGRFSARSRV